MACLLSPSERPFQDTVHIRIRDSWTKPVIFSYSFILDINSYEWVLLWVIYFWFCEQTRKKHLNTHSGFTSMLTQQYRTAVGHYRCCVVVAVTLHECHGGHHRCCESIQCCIMSSVSVRGGPYEFIEVIYFILNSLSVFIIKSKIPEEYRSDASQMLCNLANWPHSFVHAIFFFSF